jgi:hypothetical protein
MPVDDETTQLLALAHWRDRSFADLFAVWLGIAARTHPEIIRHALKDVFSLKAIEEKHNRMIEQLFQLGQREGKIVARLCYLQTQLERLEARTELRTNGTASQHTGEYTTEP